MRLIGKGESSLHAMCAVMDLPVGVKTFSFSEHANDIWQASSDAVKADQLASENELSAISAQWQLLSPHQ